MSMVGRAGPSNTLLPPGTELNGTYEIDSPLASGGMGEIYRGHEIQTGDPVAIKFIRASMADDESALALFKKEASALNRLHHEAIVRYLVFSVDPSLRRHYLAMEFVEGESLSEVLKRGPLSLNEVVALVRRVASGLQAAHDRDVVHRDVSPDNVIITNHDMAHARIIDFGIAKSTRVGDATVIGGGFAGKYNYVSPEQLGLFEGDVTGKSDIYSLGLVVAQCLRGKPIDMGGSQIEIIEKRRRLPDLSDIDARIRPLLERMLQPDPRDRFARMGDVAAWNIAAPPADTTIISPRALRQQAGPAPAAPLPKAVLPKAPPPPSPASTPVARKRSLAPLLTILLLALLGAGGFVAWLQFAPGPSPKQQASNTGPAPADSIQPAPTPGATVAGADQPTVTTHSAVTPPDDQAAQAPGPNPAPITPPQAESPDRTQIVNFIRDYDGGDCFLSVPSDATATSAQIEGFGIDAVPFDKMRTAFKLAFGFAPNIKFHAINTAQCPALGFVKSLPSDPQNVPVITIANDNLKNVPQDSPDYSELRGTVENVADPAELLLIDDVGKIYNLGNPEDHKFHFGTFRPKAMTPFPMHFLVMIVTSAQPISALQLGETRTGKPASMAAKPFFDRLTAQIASLPTAPAAAVKSFNLIE